MKLRHKVYEGPGFWGVSRVAASMKDTRVIIHGARGDDYGAALLPSGQRSLQPPFLCTNIGTHELAHGAQKKLEQTLNQTHENHSHSLTLVADTCSANLLKEDTRRTVDRHNQKNKRITLLAPYHVFKDTELSAADKLLHCLLQKFSHTGPRSETPSANIIGPAVLGFLGHQDLTEMQHLLRDLDIRVNLVFPLGSSPNDLQNIHRAWFNISTCPEISQSGLQYLKEYGQPGFLIPPFGIRGTSDFIRSISKITGIDYESYISDKMNESNKNWLFKAFNNKPNLLKSVVIFGDIAHTIGLSKVFSQELGYNVQLAGTYVRDMGDFFTRELKDLVQEILITDNPTKIAQVIKDLHPDLVLGTVNEQRLASDLQIPFFEISAPVRYPGSTPLVSSYASFLGYKGMDTIIDRLARVYLHDSPDDLLHSTFSPVEELEWTAEAKQQMNRLPAILRKKVIKIIEKQAKTTSISTVTLKFIQEVRQLETINQ